MQNLERLTMDEYIKREAAVKSVLRMRRPENSVAQNRMLSIIQMDMLKLPAADVAPVVHWVLTDEKLPPEGQDVLEMLAKKCDRCGRLYEHYDGRKSFPKSQSNSLELRDTDCKEAFWQRDRFDLCKDCMAMLESFLYGGADK